jgi:hypothetical protein
VAAAGLERKGTQALMLALEEMNGVAAGAGAAAGSGGAK